MNSMGDQLAAARKAEKEDTAQATKMYKDIIKADPLNEQAYSRLMILYRKEKDYKAEEAIIHRAIQHFEGYYKKQQHTRSAQITSLSKSIAQKTGLVNTKGSALYAPEPIASWQKRLLTVEKRLQKAK